MSINNKYYLEVWIGLAKVKSNSKDVLPNVKGAYVNVLGLSNNRNDFRKKVKLAAGEIGLVLLKLEDTEPFNKRISHHKVQMSLKKIAKEVLTNIHNIQFGTFHVYD